MNWLRFAVTIALLLWAGVVGIQRYEKRINQLRTEVTILKTENEELKRVQKIAADFRAEQEKRDHATQAALEALIQLEYANAETPIPPAVTNYLECLRLSDACDTAGLANALPAQ